MSFKKEHIPWNKGKTKNDYPQMANSGVKKGNIPWIKGKKGFIPWNKGKKGVMPEPWSKGKTKETDERIAHSAILRTGMKRPYKTRPKMRGHIPWNKGKMGLVKMSVETRRKMSISNKKAHPPMFSTPAERLRNYRKNNSDRVKKWRRKSDLLRKGVKIDDWQDVLWEYGRICLRCGEERKISLDHIIPVSIKKIEKYDNYQPLCMRCNSWKGNRVIIDYRKNFMSYTEQLKLLKII